MAFIENGWAPSHCPTRARPKKAARSPIRIGSTRNGLRIQKATRLTSMIGRQSSSFSPPIGIANF